MSCISFAIFGMDYMQYFNTHCLVLLVCIVFHDPLGDFGSNLIFDLIELKLDIRLLNPTMQTLGRIPSKFQL